MPAKKPRPRGYGSIQRDGNSFRAYGSEIQDDGTKKTVRKRFQTEKEAEAWLESLNRRKAHEQAKTGGKAPETVKDLMRNFLAHKDYQHRVEKKLDRATLDEYRGIVNQYILPKIGEVSLSAPTLKNRLMRLQVQIDEQVSSKTNKPLSASRKRNIWLVVRSAFRYGRDEGYFTTDPMVNVAKFKVPKENLREKVVPDADIERLKAYLEKKGCNHRKHICRLRWELALHSGRRQGELLGLRWEDVVLSKEGESFMKVSRKAKSRPWRHGCGPQGADGKYACEKQARYCPKRVGGGIKIEDGTKGGVSVRPVIPLDEELVEMFIEHRKHQQAEHATAVKLRTMSLLDPTHLNMVFTQSLTQRPYGARHDATIFQRILKDAGVKESYHIHQLRHTAATELSDATNGNLPVIADILGHRSIQTTRNYISPDIDARKEALEAVKLRRKKKVESKVEAGASADS